MSFNLDKLSFYFFRRQIIRFDNHPDRTIELEEQRLTFIYDQKQIIKAQSTDSERSLGIVSMQIPCISDSEKFVTKKNSTLT